MGDAEGLYDDLNAKLDELHAALDGMEMKQASIYTKLESLLESSKETRKEIQTSLNKEATLTSASEEQDDVCKQFSELLQIHSMLSQNIPSEESESDANNTSKGITDK